MLARKNYKEFLQKKQTLVLPAGFSVKGLLNPSLKEFQRALTKLSLERGRSALFASTGLGKTLMQLIWAQQVAAHAKGRILILTPLAVAEQTVAEAKKFSIGGVSLVQEQADVSTSISVTNYERLHKFDARSFSGVVLDESSILKSQDSKTRAALIEAFSGTNFKLCCTATPAPNDFTEIGNHAEFLGVCSYKEMLATFFVHDGSIRAGAGVADGWRLKRHAVTDFWRWVSSWAALVGHPKDIGFVEEGYDLPPLTKKQVLVAVQAKKSVGSLLSTPVVSLSDRLAARRDSVFERVQAAANLCKSFPNEPCLIWCGLNKEASAVTALLSQAKEVKGSDPSKQKAERLLGFCKGQPLVLVSKPSIAGFGMNWQHCSKIIFLGLNDSFEQLFQAVRRCWRFGQTKPVSVYFVVSDREGPVLKNLERKEKEFFTMQTQLSQQTAVWLRAELSQKAKVKEFGHEVPMKLPSWFGEK